jgi:hypothetical protein
MEGLTVQAWEKHGLNLLCVTNGSGRTLGYFDCNDGLLILADPKDSDLRWVVVGALARHVRRELAALPVFKPWSSPVPGGSDLVSRLADGVASDSGQTSGIDAGWGVADAAAC